LWGIVSCLIVIFVSDLKYHLISDYLQVAFFIFSFIYHLRSISQLPSFLISGFVIALPIWLIYFFSREKAMGLGDAFLAANVGFLLGLQAGFLALYVAFVIGAIFGLLLIFLRRKKFNSQVPFGPFIVIGTVTMMFLGEKIMEIIKNIYRF
jgi:prepilin signal peptidase PulO-like enzyme (type II secretory pathway)